MSEHTITELLSPAFLSRMQNMLGDEYESFLKSYEAPRTYGLLVNTAKISCIRCCGDCRRMNVWRHTIRLLQVETADIIRSKKKAWHS